jgi:hypothetical protein
MRDHDRVAVAFDGLDADHASVERGMYERTCRRCDVQAPVRYKLASGGAPVHVHATSEASEANDVVRAPAWLDARVEHGARPCLARARRRKTGAA